MKRMGLIWKWNICVGLFSANAPRSLKYDRFVITVCCIGDVTPRNILVAECGPVSGEQWISTGAGLYQMALIACFFTSLQNQDHRLTKRLLPHAIILDFWICRSNTLSTWGKLILVPWYFGIHRIICQSNPYALAVIHSQYFMIYVTPEVLPMLLYTGAIISAFTGDIYL